MKNNPEKESQEIMKATVSCDCACHAPTLKDAVIRKVFCTCKCDDGKTDDQKAINEVIRILKRDFKPCKNFEPYCSSCTAGYIVKHLEFYSEIIYGEFQKE